MKFSLFELKNILVVDCQIDYSDKKISRADLKAVSNVRVTGTLKKLSNCVEAKLKVFASATMLTANTLSIALIPLEFEMELIFGNTNDADYPLTDPLYFDDVIYGNILSELPFVVDEE